MTNENLAGLQVTASDLLDKFRAGDRVAISTVCRISARRIGRGALTEKAVLDLLHDALEKIGQGVEPNEAFGWAKNPGRPKKADSAANELLEWEVKMWVRDLMTEGLGRIEACQRLADFVDDDHEDADARGRWSEYLSEKVGEYKAVAITKGLTVETPLPMPGT